MPRRLGQRWKDDSRTRWKVGQTPIQKTDIVKLEENKTNPKYSQMILKVKTIEKHEKEIKEKIEVILA